MKTKAILLASVLLMGCQSTGNVQQHTQSLSAAGQEEAAKFTSQARQMDGGTSITPDGNLWAFIGDELRMGIPKNDRIREQKQKYLRNESYLHGVTLRAEPHVYWITGQVKKRNMSMELVLLPIVKNAFDPHAASGVSAADIWQVIPSTRRNYGLKQTHNYDARRDVVAPTIAALGMIQRLNKMFDGNWLLTVAAYNSGEGRVIKTIKMNRARGRSMDSWPLPLSQGAKQYAPKMLTLSDILKSSKRYGVCLSTTDESRALARVHLGSPVEMAKIVGMTGISISELKIFNASVKGSTLSTSGPQYVMMPEKHADQLRESLASDEIAVVQSTLVADDTPLNSRVYTVRSGDTFSSIASRLGVSTKDLQQWNKLRGSKLEPGQSLTINVSSSAQRLTNNNDSITYHVCKGDSLSSIAKRHGVSIKDVVRQNSNTASL